MPAVNVKLLLCTFAMISVAGCSLQPASRDVTPPPSSVEEDAVPAKPAAIDILRDLTSPDGMSYTPLFDEKLSSDDDRLERLEEAVENLRIDMDMVVAPAVVKLNNVAEEEATAEEAAAIALTPETAPVVQKSEVPAKGSVKAVRIGDHEKTTRLVLEITSKMKPAISFKHENTQMVIDLNGIEWAAPATRFQAETAKLIAAWNVKDGKMIVDLLSPAEVKNMTVLTPAQGQSSYRFVIDLAAK